MKIKAAILDQINNPSSRTRIALDLGIGESSIYVAMKKNLPNGRLTKMDALMAISKESGIDVNAILESETAVAEAGK